MVALRHLDSALLFASLLFLGGLLTAQLGVAHATAGTDRHDPSLADDAATCSALYSLLTSLSLRFPEFGDQVTRISSMFMDVTSFHDRSIESRGELHTRIDKEKRKIGWWYQLNRSAVFDLYYWCNSWRISIAGAMRKKSLSETGPSSTQLKEFIRQFPKSPKPSDVRRDNADTVERLVRTAFVFYETVGGYTRRDLERWLDEGHMTKEEFTEWMKTLGD